MRQEFLEGKAKQNVDCGMRNIKSQHIELNTQVEAKVEVENSCKEIESVINKGQI